MRAGTAGRAVASVAADGDRKEAGKRQKQREAHYDFLESTLGASWPFARPDLPGVSRSAKVDTQPPRP